VGWARGALPCIQPGALLQNHGSQDCSRGTRTFMVSRHTASTFGSGIALLLVTLLLAMAPFAAALEIHHELAAADHDGHEHSDTDLCQWVQYHTGHSLTGDVPVPCVFLAHGPPQPSPAPVLLSQSLPTSRASRAPPQR